MSMRHLQSILLLCFVVGWPLLGSAQTPTPTSLSSEVHFYGFGGGTFTDLYALGDDETPVPVSVFGGSRSGPFEYEGPRVFRLYRKNAFAGEDAPPFRVVAEVELAAGQDHTLLLVIANPAASGGSDAEVPEFLLFPIDNSETAAPAETVTFYNATGAPLEGVVGETAIRLGPGQSEPVGVAEHFGQRNVLVGLLVRYEGGSRIVLESRMQFYPNRRTFIVLLPPRRAGSFDITAFRIQDYLAPEEGTEAGR